MSSASSSNPTITVEELMLKEKFRNAQILQGQILAQHLPFVSNVNIEEFKILGRANKDLLLVVGVNRGLSSEERDMIPPEVNGIRIVTEYSEALPQLPPDVQQALNAANEESSSSDEEGNNADNDVAM
eukprot:TRINITY_DN2515_c0_g1_i1.p1 TRINITY_DN2515_c0_g1~~TRINITY_DN2515_c0_g1_i1.p1  ORF type:complete len:128 (-),score=34.23 TRINITY_DN2515_c0_g1_i1:203-586(-)